MKGVILRKVYRNVCEKKRAWGAIQRDIRLAPVIIG